MKLVKIGDKWAIRKQFLWDTKYLSKNMNTWHSSYSLHGYYLFDSQKEALAKASALGLGPIKVDPSQGTYDDDVKIPAMPKRPSSWVGSMGCFTPKQYHKLWKQYRKDHELYVKIWRMMNPDKPYDYENYPEEKEAYQLRKAGILKEDK